MRLIYSRITNFEEIEDTENQLKLRQRTRGYIESIKTPLILQPCLISSNEYM